MCECVCVSLGVADRLTSPLISASRSLLILLLYVSFGHLNGEENILCVPPFCGASASVCVCFT